VGRGAGGTNDALKLTPARRYCAKISRDGKLVHLGTYEKAVDAARAFDAYVIAKKMEVELNFPRSVRGSTRQRSV
jgi:hypothetical protein